VKFGEGLGPKVQRMWESSTGRGGGKGTVGISSWRVKLLLGERGGEVRLEDERKRKNCTGYGSKQAISKELVGG